MSASALAPPIDDPLPGERFFPEQDEWVNVVSKHLILNVRLESGFISRITIPGKLDADDMRRIIEGLEHIGGKEVLRQKGELPQKVGGEEGL